MRLNSDDRCLRLRTGSDDGSAVSSFGRGGVSGIGDLLLFFILRANFLNGEIDLDSVIPDLDLLD